MTKKIIVLLSFLVLILTFRFVFVNHPLSLLDSTFFFKENIDDLLAWPQLWSYRDIDFGGVSFVLWLSPLLFFASSLSHLFSINFEFFTNVFFYIPSILLALYSSNVFAKRNKVSSSGSMIFSLFYTVNTYFLLLIDGGQLGIMLSYAFLPLVISHLSDFIDGDRFTYWKSAFWSLLLMSILDPRFALISVLVVVVWKITKFKSLFKLIPLMILLLICGLFWLFPLLQTESIRISTSVSELKLTSLLNSLLVYQPHWYSNEFGKVSIPKFYFIVYPTVAALSLFIVKRKENFKYVLLILFFGFLAKGETDPFGFLYTKMLDSIPLFAAFRDSTKFFAPLILFYGLVFSTLLDKLKNTHLYVLSIIFLGIVASPVVLGKMNGNLRAESVYMSNFYSLYDYVNTDDFARIVWFPVKNQLSFTGKKIQSVSGTSFTNFKPVALGNVGGDLLNYLNNTNYKKYFDILGVRYLVFDDSIRSVDDKFVSHFDDLKKVDLSGSQLNLYETSSYQPNMRYADKLYGVVGTAIGIESTVDIVKNPVLFLEDGISSLDFLDYVDEDDFSFIFNKKSAGDLTYVLLRQNFVDPTSVVGNWARYLPEDYLKWKYELLVRGLQITDFDFSMGVTFSTKKGEELDITRNIKSGKMIVALRGSGNFKIVTDSYTQEISQPKPAFEWVNTTIDIEEGDNLKIVNNSNLSVINAILVMPSTQFDSSSDKADELLSKFGVGVKKIKNAENNWLIFSDNFNSGWKIKDKNNPSLPLYSMINGFYVNGDDQNELIFTPQKQFDIGIKLSITAIIIMVAVSLYGYFKNPNNKR